MSYEVVPMLHVLNVRATVEWYESIGFSVLNTYGDDSNAFSFAIMSFGSSQVMFNSGGHSSSATRRDADLYISTDKVDELYEQLKDRVNVVECPHDTFYGMHELIIRDLNRFWISFGKTSAFAMLMAAVREGDVAVVQNLIERQHLNASNLTAALSVAAAGNMHYTEITELLHKAGAKPPREIAVEVLQSYVGTYEGQHEFQINVSLHDRQLYAAVGLQGPLRLLAVATGV
ncbi:MAG: hypothetical protein ABR555_02225 [Pyrinomonadaceae bacterium]